MKTLQEAHHTWLNPVGGVRPTALMKGDARSKYLVELVRVFGGKDPSILEIGSSVGRNLNYLWEAGYKNLSCVEIYPGAIKKMMDVFPVRPTVYLGPIEEQIKELPRFDLIYTMAVLMHVHPESVWVFDEIAKLTDTLIVIEDEEGVSNWKWPRNYKNIFENLGFTQVSERRCSDIDGLGSRYWGRVLRKEPNG